MFMFEGPYLPQGNVSQKALSTQYTNYFDGLQKGVNNHCQEEKTGNLSENKRKGCLLGSYFKL
jgi:hypothetical protein